MSRLAPLLLAACCFLNACAVSLPAEGGAAGKDGAPAVERALAFSGNPVNVAATPGNDVIWVPVLTSTFELSAPAVVSATIDVRIKLVSNSATEPISGTCGVNLDDTTPVFAAAYPTWEWQIVPEALTGQRLTHFNFQTHNLRGATDLKRNVDPIAAGPHTLVVGCFARREEVEAQASTELLILRAPN